MGYIFELTLLYYNGSLLFHKEEPLMVFEFLRCSSGGPIVIAIYPVIKVKYVKV
jgi:hypothetical protein